VYTIPYASPQGESVEQKCNLLNIIFSIIKNGVTELHVHPAVFSEELKSRNPTWKDRVNEYEALKCFTKELLMENAVSKESAEIGIKTLEDLEESMHGAMLIDKDTGKRIDDKGIKGVRVTGIASADITKYKESLKNDGREGLHLEEALILASKIASCKGIVAELCWSDDPSYVIGYVAAKDNYERIPILKEEGNPIGGRVFFVDSKQLNDDYTLDDLIDYLENQIVLIE
jgi:6-carboxyhexanoate--CoA ligase